MILRMNDMRSLHVVNALGPSTRLHPRGGHPQGHPRLSRGAWAATIPRSMERYLDLPFPRLSQIDGADKDAAWRDAVSRTRPGWRAVGRPLRTQSDHRRRRHRPLRDRSAAGTLPAQPTTEYTLEPPASDFSSPYAAFLFDTDAGYCQHFAGAMALLLRFNGIPARVAVGFTSGDRMSAGVYSVSTNNAHAWVEAYFPTVGWVAFDPTPGRDLPNAGRLVNQPGLQGPLRRRSFRCDDSHHRARPTPHSHH